MREPGVLRRRLADEAATRAAGAALGRALAQAASAGAFVALEGELGAGKTTLVRGLLRALGVASAVRSPTYTLLESYALADGTTLHHLDWYRLASADELESIGFRDLQGPGQWLLVEWADRIPAVGAGADLTLRLAHSGAERRLEGRANGAAGARMLALLEADETLK